MQLRNALFPVVVLAFSVGCPSSSSRAAQRADGLPTDSSAPGPQDPAITQAVQAAQALEAAGDHAAAFTAFEGLVAGNPKSPQLPELLQAMARNAHKLGDRAGARRAWERVAMEFPTHPASHDAKLHLAGLDLEEGRTAEGVTGMRNALEQLPQKDRQPFSKKMGLALMESDQFAAAVMPLSAAEMTSPQPAEKEQLRATLLDLVDRELRLEDMLGLREQLPEGSYARNLLTLKLARMWVHLGDEARARDELRTFLAAAPNDPLAPSAQQLLKMLEDRSVVAAHRLGIVLPTSGKYAQAAERVLAALKMGLESAAKEVATQSGKPVDPVEVVVVDDKGEVEDAVHAVDGLVAEHRVMALAGPLTPLGASAAAVRAEALKVPLMTMARKEGLAEMGPYTFSFSLTDERQAREVARVAATQMGFKRVALLYPRLPRGVSLINAFWDEFESRGGNITGAEGYDHDETTFTTPIRKLVGRHYMDARYEHISCMAEARKIEQAYKKQKAMEGCTDAVKPMVDFDAVFVADWHKPVGLIAPALAFEDVFVGNDERALRQFKEATGSYKVRKVLLLGTNGFHDKTLPQRGGKYVQGAVFVDGFNPNDGRPENVAFQKAFAAAVGAKPDLREAQAYDTGRVLGFVFAQNPTSRAAFRDLLSKVKDYAGVTGPITMDEQGSAVAPLHVFTIKNAAIVPAVFDPPSGG